MTTRASRLFLIGYDGMNYPLLRRFVSEGVLPHFEALLARGSLNRLLPSLPAWTPTNWSSVVTGAPAGTHQLGGWSVRDSGSPNGRTLAWDASAYGGADTLWDVADKLGKRCLVTHYPAGSWDRGLTHGYVVAPGVHEAPFSYALSTKYTATTPGFPVGAGKGFAGISPKERSTDAEEQGDTPGQNSTALVPASRAGWDDAGPHDLAAILPVVQRVSGEVDDLHLLVRCASPAVVDSVLVCSAQAADSVLVEVPQDRWSDFVQISLSGLASPAAMRFAVLSVEEVDGAGVRLELVRSVAYATKGFAQPAGLDETILEQCGPFFDLYSVDPDVDDRHLALWLDEMRYMGEWQVRVAKHVGDEHGWDLHFSHWHAFDWINHITGNGLEADSPQYDPGRADWLLDAQRQTYRVADDILGQFLELEQEGDLVCVVADHGITPTYRYGDIGRRLEDVGLTKRTPAGEIDWSQTRAYFMPERGAEVFVNLAGREPHGIVGPSDLVEVQEAIIDALLDWRDPSDQRRICAFALKAEDGQLVGYWGEQSGDVVYVFNRGFGWGAPTNGEAVGDGRIAIHGSQIPTSESETMTNMGCLAIAGPGVKAGYERDWRRWGLMRMIDIAPTVAARMGLPAPAHNSGSVLSDIFTP